jgi:hypothetical protein
MKINYIKIRTKSIVDIIDHLLKIFLSSSEVEIYHARPPMICMIYGNNLTLCKPNIIDISSDDEFTTALWIFNDYINNQCPNNIIYGFI